MSTITQLTLAEYDRMIACGVFEPREGRRLEFIQGAIRQMMPVGALHEVVVDRLNEWSIRTIPTGEVWVRVQNSIGLPQLRSAPEPDICWVVRRDYSRSRPSAQDVLLVIEVADSSLAYDRGEKAELYAAAGIREYWVVNLIERLIEVYRDLGPQGYRQVRTYRDDEELRPLAFPQVVLRPGNLWEE
jgi:Uma2 family endonuclease